MNQFVVCLVTLALLAVVSGLDPLSLGIGGVALATAGGGTIALTSAGVIAGAVGLLGAGVVAGALIGGSRGGRGGFGRRRGKRNAETGEEEEESVETLAGLQLVDSYFMTILDVDVDDCGKKLVCEIKTVPEGDLTTEENLIGNLFDESTTIDPLSAKAEYDLAAFIGANYDKAVCARRYHRCELNRRTIVQGLQKLGRDEKSA